MTSAPTPRIEPTGSTTPRSNHQTGGRFVPGTIINERYRIFGLIGQGGMGEVYRADDLKLGQPVALKFLPEQMRDRSSLDRFFNEVRVAREISHPNICRIHDIFDFGGKHFLSMEFVDGEDLASLLRRIGRLPEEKAVDIARQLCAGIAAAHARDILHRDLKPANIMIDGQGQVRIMDFGLAGVSETFAGAEIRAGTPSYMSPEQITGTEVTARSDLFALGLVLHELFTGKKVFDGRTVAEITAMHESSPRTPSSVHLGAYEPAIERIVTQCLERDPSKRPATALAVAAALPGGDPLAAALAAGETPSPELVAASGESGAMKPPIALGFLLFVLAGLVAIAIIQPPVLLLYWCKPEKPLVILADKSRQILESLGYTDDPVAVAGGYGRDASLLFHVEKTSQATDRWAALARSQPAVMVYWHREHARPFHPLRPYGRVNYRDPPQLERGMIRMLVDSSGRLTELNIIPDNGPFEGDARKTDWSTVFDAAGLDIATFEPAAPWFSPPMYCEEVRAWKGVYPDNPDLPLRVESGSHRGRIVHFTMSGPWRERPVAQDSNGANAKVWRFGFFDVARLCLQLTIVVGAMILARRNQRHGRGDRKGAFRLSITLALVNFLAWAGLSDHGSTPQEEWELINQALGRAIWTGVFTLLLYMAIEPHVRRMRPHTIISWTRLLSGRLRDPLVGRDILLGGCTAILMTFSQYGHWTASTWFGGAPPRPMMTDFRALGGLLPQIGGILQRIPEAIYMPMICLMVLLIFRLVLRHTWLSLIAFFVVFIWMYPAPTTSELFALDVAGRTVYGLLAFTLLLRFGILPLMFAMFFNSLLVAYPMMFDLSLWYSTTTTITALVIAVPCAYGFYVALAGQPLFKTAILD
jgi:serine/threonine-protein kinase